MNDVLLRFVHITDTHLSDEPDYGLHESSFSSLQGAQALVERINALPFQPDFILHSGDMAYDPYPSAYPVVKQVLAGLRAPLYFVRGNHDSNAEVQRQLLNRDEKEMTPYLNYTTSINGVQLIVLDTNGPADPPAGNVSEGQLAWLRDLCAADDERPLVVAMHHSPLVAGIPWLNDFMGLQNADAVHEALLPARHRLRGVFLGHVHQVLDFYRDGILYATAPSSWCQFHAWPEQVETLSDREALPGFSIVSLTKDATYIRRCVYRL